MGVTRIGVHLPVRALADKELRGAGLPRHLEGLRLPWWDEDPLTMAVEAGLQLHALPDHLERIHLALDAPTDQPGLAAIALGLDMPVVQHAGPNAGLTALVAADPGPSLVLAGGAVLGGAGVAVLLEPAQGAAVVARRAAHRGGLGAGDADAIAAAVDGLKGGGPLLVPPGHGGPKGPTGAIASSLAKRVGDAGAAAVLLELAAHLDRAEGPLRLASVARGEALAVAVGDGAVRVTGLDQPSVETTLAAWRALTSASAEPWAEASQGAYVSAEEYEADPVARYSCRAMGPATVEAVTTIEAGPPGEFVRQHEAAGPYDVAIVSLADGRRRIVQSAAPPGALAIGDAVAPVLRRLFSQEGAIRYAVKVVPGEA